MDKLRTRSTSVCSQYSSTLILLTYSTATSTHPQRDGPLVSIRSCFRRCLRGLPLLGWTYYLSCLVVNWWFYARKGAETPC